MKCSVSMLSVFVLIGAAGCGGAGLSHRQSDGEAYSDHVLALFDQAQLPDKAAPVLRFPAAVAVAQIGEVSPPSKMLEQLRAATGVFSRVETLPGIFNGFDGSGFGNVGPGGQPVESGARARMRRLQEMARSTGADYLLVFGGTVDYTTRNTGFSVLDLTIVGAFIIPSEQTRGEARAAAALVELQSGRVVLSTSTDAVKSTYSASATAEGEQRRLVEELRNEVTGKLADQLIQECNRRQSGQHADFKPTDDVDVAEKSAPVNKAAVAPVQNQRIENAPPAAEPPATARPLPALTTKTHYDF